MVNFGYEGEIGLESIEFRYDEIQLRLNLSSNRWIPSSKSKKRFSTSVDEDVLGVPVTSASSVAMTTWSVFTLISLASLLKVDDDIADDIGSTQFQSQASIMK